MANRVKIQQYLTCFPNACLLLIIIYVIQSIKTQNKFETLKDVSLNFKFEGHLKTLA